MGLLDSFEQMNKPEIPYISLSKYGTTFSTLSLELLSEAENVHIFIDKKNKQFAVQPCKKDESSLELVNKDSKHPRFVRWSSRDTLRTLLEVSGVNVEDGTVKFPGKYYDSENLIIYDLSKPKKVKE